MGNLGWPEILIILAVALIIFGPRKLPQLGKSLGESLAQFRRASEDFKRTWETEVDTEQRRLSTVTTSDTISSDSAPAIYSENYAEDNPASSTEEAAPQSEDNPASSTEEAAPQPTEQVAATEPRQDWM